MRESTRKFIESNLRNLQHGKKIDLSDEQLTIEDYHWLAKIIQESTFLETILLPKIAKESTETVLNILESATIKHSTLTMIDYGQAEFDEHLSSAAQSMHQKIQSRLARNKKKIFAIHGGGNIGLGLMADIISKSKAGYSIVATSSNQYLRDLINVKKQVWLQHGAEYDDNLTRVDNVTMVSREKDAIITLYSQACQVALCVTPDAMNEIAKDIAQAIISRYETDGSGVKILVLMNIPDCATFVYEKIFMAILDITNDIKTATLILSASELVPTVIDRIVTPISMDKLKIQLKDQLQQYSSEVSKFCSQYHDTEVPKSVDEQIELLLNTPEMLIKLISQLNLHYALFNAEKNFAMYVSRDYPEAYQFPLIKKTKVLSQIEAIKNKFINGPHAILAWLGGLIGYKTIAETIKNPVINQFIQEMMDLEIAPILMAEYPDMTKEELDQLKLAFIERCHDIDDAVIRVARDPFRKLNKNARIRGTLELAQKHKLDISTTRLEFGVAAGFLYSIKGIDSENPGCEQIAEIFKANNKDYTAVLCYSGSVPSGEFTGFCKETEGFLIQNILLRISRLIRWCDSNMKLEEVERTSRPIPIISPEQRVKSMIAPANIRLFPSVGKEQMETSPAIAKKMSPQLSFKHK